MGGWITDHVETMEAFMFDIMFDRMQLMERKSFALATDTVAKGVVQEATEWINRSKKRKVNQTRRRQETCEVACGRLRMEGSKQAE
jgi:hypothetical protein